MKKVVVDPSVAGLVDINAVSFGEEVDIYYNADANWVGSFSFTLWNSNVKNNVITNQCTLTVNGMLMTLLIKGIEKGTHYYEIWSTTQKRIIFKGELVVV